MTTTIRLSPVGRLGIIPHKSCSDLGRKVDEYLVRWRRERQHSYKNHLSFSGYERDTFIIPPRFPALVPERPRALLTNRSAGDDLFILVDVCNYS